MTTPYTYLIGWTEFNMWYYGVQYGKNANPDNLWKTYFTSSRHVRSFVENHGNPDVIKVRKTFNSAKSAKLWEDKVLLSIPKETRHLWLNKRFGTFVGSVMDDTTILKISKAFLGSAPARVYSTGEFIGNINRDDVRWKSGEIVGINNGLVIANNSNGVSIMISKEEFDSGQYVGVVTGKHKNMAPAKDINGNKLGFISKNDPRWESGEIVGANKGSKCGQRGYSLAIDNDTNNIIGKINNNDPRWASGEIRHNRKGTTFEMPQNRKSASAKCPVTGVSLGRILLTDERWKTGEVVGVKKNININILT